MTTTKATRNSTPAGLARTGKIIHAYFGLLGVLAVSAATCAWGQNPDLAVGPHRLPAAWSGASAEPAVSLAASRYKFTTISPADSPYAVAAGINNAGVVTGYFLDQSSNYHGFVWAAGNFLEVDYPGATDTLLFFVNNKGVAMGYYGDGTTFHTVTYAVSTGVWTALPDIPNYSQNEGYSVNDRGVAVGNAYQGSASVAWMWDSATSSYTFLVAPGAAPDSTFPSSIDDKGEIIGYYADFSGVYHGFLVQYGTYTTIDMPGAADTYPDGINNRGMIEGQIQSASGALEGFMATEGGIFEIVNYPRSQATAIVGINEAGDLCGSYGGTDFANARAFVASVQ